MIGRPWVRLPGVSASARISPTAHYTGYVWCRHKLSPPELATTRGRLMFEALRWPMQLAARANSGLTLELLLLQRHHIIDHLLSEAVASGAVSQIVEVAAGMSGRGLRLTARFPELVYVEADLPAMAAGKRERLARLAGRSHRHHVVDVDALETSGPLSLVEAAGVHVDPSCGIAVVTEGLLNYFPRELVERIWRNITTLMAMSSAGGTYVSDLHLRDHTHQRVLVRTFRALLGKFARGSIHLHYADEREAAAALHASGFDGGVRFVRPPDVEHDVPIPPHNGLHYVNILHARF